METKQDRRRRLAREKWERQQQRRRERRMRARKRSIITGVVVLTLAVIGGGLFLGRGLWLGDDAEPAANEQPTSTPTPTPEAGEQATPSGAPSPTARGECIYVRAKSKDEKWFGLPPAKVDLSVPFKDFAIETNLGTLEGELFNETAPCAVNSFEHLAKNEAFTDTTCGELATEPASVHYLGCGDLTGTGLGGPGYVFATENTAGRETYEAGLLVLLDGADRGGSRFAITYGDPQKMGHIGTVFGTVKNGLDIVRGVAKAGTDEMTVAEGIGRPKKTLVFKDVTISG